MVFSYVLHFYSDEPQPQSWIIHVVEVDYFQLTCTEYKNPPYDKGLIFIF